MYVFYGIFSLVFMHCKVAGTQSVLIIANVDGQRIANIFWPIGLPSITRARIFALKIHQFRCELGLRPTPTTGELTALPWTPSQRRELPHSVKQDRRSCCNQMLLVLPTRNGCETELTCLLLESNPDCLA